MVAGCILFRNMARADPATMWLDLCPGGIGRADRVDCAASLHSRPGSRAARLIGKMAYDKDEVPAIF